MIAWSSAPLTDETGAVVGIIAGGIDITERKRHELELQAERDAPAALVQTIPTLSSSPTRTAPSSATTVRPASTGLPHDLGWDATRSAAARCSS